jgi:flagellar biosynthesis GTPase FlhF
MFNMLESFGEFSIDKIFITKLDETEAPGGVVTAVIGSGKRLSYVSRSREIPGQFGIANPESLAMAVLTGAPVKEDKPQWQMEAVGIWQ